MINLNKNQNWHLMDGDDVLSELSSSKSGLSSENASKRLISEGSNVLSQTSKRHPVYFLLSQFTNYLVIILLLAVAISFFVGEIIDAIVILFIVVAISLMGFIQEYKADRSLETLKKMSNPHAIVLRDGVPVEIPSSDLVIGDIVTLTAGSRVQADGRIIEASDLHVDESSLTGESVPVDKNSSALPKDVSIHERTNSLFSSTLVTSGKCSFIVTSTGMNTEFGKIADTIQKVKPEKTPLEIKLDHVGKWLTLIMILTVLFVISIGLFRGYNLVEMFIWGISLAVAAVPEALPAVVTGALAIGVNKMAKRKVIVKKLPAVETLGSTTIICSDKTGTLTKNEMMVRNLFFINRFIDVSGNGYDPVGTFSMNDNPVDPLQDEDLQLASKICVLCNHSTLNKEKNEWKPIGDPTESALLTLSMKASVDPNNIREHNPIIKEILFTSERKRMTTIHSISEDENIAYVKGAFEVLLDLSTKVQINGKVHKITDEHRKILTESNESLSNNGLRVLAVAYRRLSKKHNLEKFDENDLTIVGLVAMMDIPRKESKMAAKVAREAGIKTIMITGDQKSTALAIAKEIGIYDGGLILTGSDLDQLTDDEFSDIVSDVDIYARVSPLQKLKIVKALKSKGEVIAMTGDGVNDAPALKAADIGIAMGISGTDISLETSDMILTDDNFASIISALEEGRTILDNITKYLAYLLSSNIGELLLIFLTSLLGFPLPLVAIQILWINLVTDGLPALALGVDPPEPDRMKRPPRNNQESIFDTDVKVLITSIVLAMVLITLPIFIWYESTQGLIKAQTMVFTTIIMFEMYNAFNCQSIKYSLKKIGFTSNKFLILSIIASILLHVLIMHVGFLSSIFHVVPLTLYDWGIAILFSSIAIPAAEIGKMLSSRLRSSN